MADHADHDGKNIFPSLGLVAWKTGYSLRQVRRIIRSLQDRKILSATKQRTGHAVVYAILFANAPKKRRYYKDHHGDLGNGDLGNGDLGNGDLGHLQHLTPDMVTSTPDIAMSAITVLNQNLQPSAKPSLSPVERAKGARRCPCDYVPSTAVRQWAAEKHPAVPFDEALDAMRDYEFAKAHTDWDATLRTWIRNEAKRLPRNGRTGVLQTTGTTIPNEVFLRLQAHHQQKETQRAHPRTDAARGEETASHAPDVSRETNAG